MARGQNVLAAGEGKVLWGEVKYIKNASGHYLPQGASAEAAAVKAFSDYGFKVPEGAYVNRSTTSSSENGEAVMSGSVLTDFDLLCNKVALAALPTLGEDALEPLYEEVLSFLGCV
ncbi:hypothetical protein [Eleftheria terrae]|uniref:hypothetical protein n=1 Tax=Eleftheria terrae TaxID=1597781 RepID=UPI00263B053A|nr:hypothetical protein [Eleftheria terrae]WKB55626.1 hypothetical protein N7L95_26495 [Eleftheria terrae]